MLATIAIYLKNKYLASNPQKTKLSNNKDTRWAPRQPRLLRFPLIPDRMSGYNQCFRKNRKDNHNLEVGKMLWTFLSLICDRKSLEIIELFITLLRSQVLIGTWFFPCLKAVKLTQNRSNTVFSRTVGREFLTFF